MGGKRRDCRRDRISDPRLVEKSEGDPGSIWVTGKSTVREPTASRAWGGAAKKVERAAMGEERRKKEER